MPAFRPRVGVEQEQPFDRRRGQRRQEQPRIVVEYPDIGEGPVLDMAQQGGDAVDKGLAADEADIGMGFGLPGQMLAGAEADFQPAGLTGRSEQRRQIDRAALGKPDQKVRQQGLDQPGAALAQRPALAAAVKPVPGPRPEALRKFRRGPGPP